jgi:predicted phage terminase large subunit-like protein
MSRPEIKPQPGPQEDFLSCSADICIYGGSAGGGKTFSELLEPLHYITKIPGFNAICFRRTTPMIRSGGGLWDESIKIYSGKAEPKESTLEWLFPCAGTKTPNRLKFAHLEYEKNALDYQGAQLCLIMFDELTHFTEQQFWYLTSRNRSVCGVKPYIRATCNPDPDSWVAGMIDWWIGEDGYPIKERSGVIRYFVRENNELIWADTEEELKANHPELTPRSFTFISATLEDNPILMKADPSYRANLLALPEVEKERLLHGNWKIRPAGGNVFKREWFRHLVPENILQQAQFTFKIGSWDTAFKVDSKDGDASDPDFSVYTLWGVNQQGFFLLDRYKEKLEYPDLLNAALNLYNRDRPNALLIEDKASGQSLIQSLRSCGMPVPIVPIKPIGTKIDRAYQAVPFFSAGMVHFPAGAYWLHDYIETLVGFPDAAHDDDVDSTSQAIIWYSQGGISGGGKQIMQAIEDDYCI